MNKIYLAFYYGFAQFLPGSYIPVIGKLSNRIRIFCVKHIFKSCGNISTIDRRAYFGNGHEIEIGDYSGIGANCQLPNNIKIGKYVMMAPDVIIFPDNHVFKDTTTPMCFQGKTKKEEHRAVIEDDCWIGQRAIINAGKTIKKGCIVAAGAVVTKDTEEFSIVGGNPAKIIKYRR